jgi:hypothetical protein
MKMKLLALMVAVMLTVTMAVPVAVNADVTLDDYTVPACCVVVDDGDSLNGLDSSPFCWGCGMMFCPSFCECPCNPNNRPCDCWQIGRTCWEHTWFNWCGGSRCPC